MNNQPISVRHRRSAENIAAVRESVRENPRRSISRRSQELGLSATSTWRILRRDLDLHSYKIQLIQELKVNDHRQRHVFADWVLEQLEVNPNFAKQIIFNDEAHFWMNGYVNKQNVEFGTIPIHARYTSSKCIPRESLFGADFGLRNHRSVLFQNEAGFAITINERYRSMISNFLWPKMDNMDTDNIWF